MKLSVIQKKGRCYMFVRQPRYFKDFHCIGSECVDNCCHGWRIDWTNEEVDKLKEAENASPELKELIERSFIPGENGKLKIKFDDKDNCPFQTSDRLCRIQKELGAEYLSSTCTYYPRIGIIGKTALYRYCFFTCEAVMRILINDDRAMNLVNVDTREKSITLAAKNTMISKPKQPELQYFEEVFEFFYEIIADKKRDVEDSLVLGTLAAQALSKLSEKNKCEQIPEAIKLLKSQMHNGEQLKSIANIEPNYNVKLGILGQLLKLICKNNRRDDPTFALIDSEGKYNINLYAEGELALKNHFMERPFAMRNIALNLLFELFTPFGNEDYSIFENYAVYVTTFALLKLNSIAIARIQNKDSQQKNSEEIIENAIINSASTISRSLCQNINTDKVIMAALSANGMVTPGFLALLVK